jgi:hypothetical protein
MRRGNDSMGFLPIFSVARMGIDQQTRIRLAVMRHLRVN